jgi:uncharacterized protein
VCDLKFLNSIVELEDIYSAKPTQASTAKDIGQLTPEYRKLIAASPFLTLATSGPEGLDCSPRGDKPGFVRVIDDKTIVIPDRRGNNRIDSLRNIIRDPRVALLFLIPGSGTTLRINGTAQITTDAEVLKSFAVEDKEPRSAIVISIEACYFQCARALVRSDLWNPEKHVSAGALPSPGQVLERLTNAEIDGKHYDTEWPERAKKTMW